MIYFLLITRASINERIGIYAELTKEIAPDAFDGNVSALKTLAITDTQQRDFVAALDGNIYHNLPKARMALVLRLESLLRDPGVQLQNAVTLEHVLSQTPPDGSDWLRWFPDEDERNTWTHRLANLVLLDRRKNSSAGNYDFATKKEVYFKGKKGTASPFVLTQEVRSESDWTPQRLAERQKRLVGMLIKHWNLAVTSNNR